MNEPTCWTQIKQVGLKNKHLRTTNIDARRCPGLSGSGIQREILGNANPTTLFLLLPDAGRRWGGRWWRGRGGQTPCSKAAPPAPENAGSKPAGHGLRDPIRPLPGPGSSRCPLSLQWKRQPGLARPVPAHLAPGGQPWVNGAGRRGSRDVPPPRPVIAAARPQRHFRRCAWGERRRRGWRGRPGGACAGAERRGAPRSPRGLWGIPGWPLPLTAERS